MSAPPVLRLTVNGEPARVDADARTGPPTLADLVTTRVGAVEGHAVALNGTVVRRSALATTPLADGDEVEIVTAVQGG